MQLHTLNPSIKALAILVLVFCVSFVFDPVTPFIFWLFIIAVTFIFGKINMKKWLLFFIPFLILSLGSVWTSALFADPPSDVKLNTLFSLGPIVITDYGLSIGLSLGLRVLCFSCLSLLFILTTDPIKFIFSLVQQCKMPPKFAYGLLAGYRFLPLLHDELKIIRHAHRVRGVNREKGIRGKLTSMMRYVIPLLASAIRKAERAAIAMESKGFTGSRTRTHYHKLYVRWQDWLFLVMIIGLFFISMFISMKLGTFRGYDSIL